MTTAAPAQAGASVLEQLADLPADERDEVIGSLSDDEALALMLDWRATARPKQIAPPERWLVWLIISGRGFGKTRTGTGWVHEEAMAAPGRNIALVGKTPADIRDYMIEGPGGLLGRDRDGIPNIRPDERPHYEPSKRRVTWPNDSVATLYSSEEPDQLRGFSGDRAWVDELCKYRSPRLVWENLMFGMREASVDQPRTLVTTTPRPITLLAELKEDPDTHLTTGSSYENRANLSPIWFSKTLQKYEGTRLGRQEIWGEILDDIPGALWNRSMLEACRRHTPRRTIARVVVAIDPQASTNEDSAETGIVVAGLYESDPPPRATPGLKPAARGCVLADGTVFGKPEAWASAAVKLYHEFEADRIIGEVNNGGDMVESVIRAVDQNIPYRAVRASRGKVKRAEPVAALYEQGRIDHVGNFPELEDQMCQFEPTMIEGGDLPSPDRVDAAVWAFTDLIISPEPEGKRKVIEFA